jgi:hypothetical protein
MSALRDPQTGHLLPKKRATLLPAFPEFLSMSIGEVRSYSFMGLGNARAQLQKAYTCAGWAALANGVMFELETEGGEWDSITDEIVFPANKEYSFMVRRI